MKNLLLGSAVAFGIALSGPASASIWTPGEKSPSWSGATVLTILLKAGAAEEHDFDSFTACADTATAVQAATAKGFGLLAVFCSAKFE